jgi:hypothetical protein
MAIVSRLGWGANYLMDFSGNGIMLVFFNIQEGKVYQDCRIRQLTMITEVYTQKNAKSWSLQFMNIRVNKNCLLKRRPMY